MQPRYCRRQRLVLLAQSPLPSCRLLMRRLLEEFAFASKSVGSWARMPCKNLGKEGGPASRSCSFCLHFCSPFLAPFPCNFCLVCFICFIWLCFLVAFWFSFAAISDFSIRIVASASSQGFFFCRAHLLLLRPRSSMTSSLFWSAIGACI